MTAHVLVLLLQVAGLFHLGLIWAGATMPKAVQLPEALATLPPFIRRLFYVYFTFIGLTLLGFGILTFVFAEQMAAGDPLGRGLSILMTVFWSVRLVAAMFIFDVRPYLHNGLLRVGYAATNVVFVYLLAVYALTAVLGGQL